MSVVLFIVFSIVFIVGMCDLLHVLRLILIKPKIEPQKLLILRLQQEDAYQSLLSVYEKYKWHGKYLADKIICIHKNILDESVKDEFLTKGIFFVSEEKVEDLFLNFGDQNGENRAEGHSRKNYISQP